MEVGQGKACVGGIASHWLEHQAANRIAPNSRARCLADYVFAFHDKVEIGPKMLSKIAKHTGLESNDL